MNVILNRMESILKKQIIHKICCLMVITLAISCGNSEKQKQKTNSIPDEKNKTITDTIENRLLIVTLDGVRWKEVFEGADPYLLFNPNYMDKDSIDVQKEFWADNATERRKKLMPFFWNTLANKGKLFGNRNYGNKVNVTNPAVKSYPGYNEILTGFPDPNILTNNHKANHNINVLEFLNSQPSFHGKVEVIAKAPFFERILNIERNKLSLTLTENDSASFEVTKRKLVNNHPMVCYMPIFKTDHYAHDGNYDKYLEIIHRTDAWIAELWSIIQKDPFYKGKTTLLITTDHGRGLKDKWLDHGMNKKKNRLKPIPHAEEIWFAAIGPHIKGTGEQKSKSEYKQSQIAKTIAAIFNLDFNTGRAVGEPIKAITNN